ncbi:hypothetical protein [Denitromonas iodatirespirans]|uniref:Uncharacterized protein n=1 Tax=Denitromonas iodatirespirans TaxID=2795389 RepID=A0A944DEG9_DENI1|nr:hypothetical protein [Denitromonas iodatirespirans]MBT0964047.1 hypothetical protein [Denitromonas iodatirespirans]
MKHRPHRRAGLWLALAMAAVAALAARAWNSPDLLLALQSLEALCR